MIQVKLTLLNSGHAKTESDIRMESFISDRLRAAMHWSPKHQRRVTTTELAAQLGITSSRLSQIRHGTSMSVRQLIDICEYLGVTYEWLLTGKGDVYSEEAEAFNHEQQLALQALRLASPGVRHGILQLLSSIVSETTCLTER